MRTVLRVALAGQGVSAADLANLLLMLVYAQFESPHPVPDPFGDTRGGAAHRLAGAANALTMVMLQFPAAPDRGLANPAQAATRGGAVSRRSVAVCAGDTAIWWHWIVAVVLLSVRECILFPCSTC